MSNNTIWDEYKNSLSEFLTEKATGDIIKIKDEGNLKMISHSKMEDNDGLTKARIVDQKKIYTIEFKKSVLRSRFRCWKLALIAHEFCHMLTYADKNVDTQEKIDKLPHHGQKFQSTVRRSVRSSAIKREVLKKVGSRPSCVYKNRNMCRWCNGD